MGSNFSFGFLEEAKRVRNDVPETRKLYINLCYLAEAIFMLRRLEESNNEIRDRVNTSK